MTWAEIIRSLAALAGVVGVILLGGWVLRRWRVGGAATPTGRARRLQWIETAAIDPRRKSAVLRWDDREYLIVFAGDHGVVLADKRSADGAREEEDPSVES